MLRKIKKYQNLYNTGGRKVLIIHSQGRRQKIFQGANSQQKILKFDKTKLVEDLEWIFVIEKPSLIPVQYSVAFVDETRAIAY